MRRKVEKLRKVLLNEGIVIELDSTYRSVKRQQEIWDQFEQDKGIEYAKQYVAVPGYSYEPWHFRYVGSTKVAKEIMSKGLTLEEYLEKNK